MTVLLRAWRAVGRWLSYAPIADPVDRSNAVVLQVFFLFLLTTVPPLWFFRLVISDVPLRAGEGFSAMLSGVIVLLVGLGFWLVRRGHFQWVLRSFLIIVALALMASYLAQGAEANRYEAPLQLAWLVMAGLMVGRKALWLLYGWIGLAVLLGTAVDVKTRGVSWANYSADAIVNLMIYLLITLLVDRAATAFRRALTAAHAREQELIVAGQDLREEIVERERIHKQLIHSQKVEVAGRLAAGLAHDFNHLLSLILAYRARASASSDRESLEKALAGIDAATRRATAVSQRLLSFSRRGEGSSQTAFDINLALEEMQPMLRQLFGADVQLTFSDTPRPLPVLMDRSEFELIVLNIAANSHAAMPQGGRFEIATSFEDVDGVGMAYISLSDTGCGMDEATSQQALEPFFTNRSDGTGLGLAVAFDVLAAAGGELTFESTLDVGTTVHLKLPIFVQQTSMTSAG